MAARDWYIAWLADPAEPFDPVAHKRADVRWRSISLTESEGADATLVTIGTERLATDSLRGKRWAMLSFEHPDGTLYPIARMKRRKLAPGSRDGEMVLEFEAGLTPGWKDRRDTGLAELKKQAAYDPILVSPTRQTDPTEILDGHRRIGHFDRVTGEYSTPELLGQGLPSRTFTPSDWIGWDSGGGISVSRSGKEGLAGVQLTISAAWLQILEGLYDMSGSIADLFPELNLRADGQPTTVNQLFRDEWSPGATRGPTGEVATGLSSPPDSVIGKGVISTLTPDEILSGFPQPGASLGGQTGYTVVAAQLNKIAATLFAGGTQPSKAGPVYGSGERYTDYTAQPAAADGKKPPDKATEMALDITYFTALLIVAFSARQQRGQVASVYVPNGACDDPDAPVRTLSLRCEDPTVDQTTVPWLPVTRYQNGDVRRFGWYSWIALKDHLSTGSFNADVASGKWRVAPQDASYIGGPGGTTYFTLPRGIQTICAGILKATKIIALAQRCPVEFKAPFEDVVAMSTAWAARIEAEDRDLQGGFAEGKVVAFSVKDSEGGYPEATIRIAPCDGTGEATPVDGGTRVGYTDAPWDVVSLQAVAGVAPPQDVAIGGSATVQNNVQQQLAFVQANDFRVGSVDRGDKSKNDPKSLLRQVTTKFGFVMAPITGGPVLTHYVPLVCTPWQGPKQIDLPNI